MDCWDCTRVTGLLVEGLMLRNTPPNGVGRTGMLWTGEPQIIFIFWCKNFVSPAVFAVKDWNSSD